jgi:hypothetical protein
MIDYRAQVKLGQYPKSCRNKHGHRDDADMQLIWPERADHSAYSARTNRGDQTCSPAPSRSDAHSHIKSLLFTRLKQMETM